MTADLTRLALRRFLVIGRAGMDLYADPPGTRIDEATQFTAALGGSSANIAVALARAGCRVAMLGCVSDDAVGRFCLAQLDHYGVDRRHMRAVTGEQRTSLAVVETRAVDCQSVIYRNNAADFQMTPADVEAVDLSGFGGVILTGTVFAAEPSRGAARRALELARAAGVPLILDLDYRPYSWPASAVAAQICAEAAAQCDVIVGNDEEFGLLAGGLDAGLDCARALARTAPIVVYKRGAQGAITLTAGREITTGIYATQAIKPTGAGDSFLGAFVAGLADGRPVIACIARGSAAAAMVVARVGCAPAMPTASELDVFLAAHPGPNP